MPAQPPTIPSQPPYIPYKQAYPAAQWAWHPHLAKARGFGQLFGLHPGIAALAMIVDLMLFGGDVVTAGAILPLSVGCAAVLGFITYKTQRRWYGDDKDAALIKSLILGLLTAIPAPIPAILSIPSGLIGLVHGWRRR